MKAAIVGLLVSCSAFAQETPPIPPRIPDAPIELFEVKEGAFLTPDGLGVRVEGGVWLSPDFSVKLAKEIAGLRAENETLKKPPESDSSVIWIGLALLTGVAAGSIVTAFLVR